MTVEDALAIRMLIYATADEADVFVCFVCFFSARKKYETTVLGNG